MPNPLPLSVELLEALKTRWRAQKAPLIDRLLPGLDEGKVDELTAPLGLRLPREAKTWWGWHNGVARADARLAAFGELGAGIWFYSLEDAVDLCAMMRKIAAEAWEDRADFWWRPDWFPITDRSGPIRCDCSDPDATVTPIYWAFSHDYDYVGLTEPRAPSLGTVVTWWIEALDEGVWHYEPSLDRWVYEWERVPPSRQGLV